MLTSFAPVMWVNCIKNGHLSSVIRFKHLKLVFYGFIDINFALFLVLENSFGKPITVLTSPITIKIYFPESDLQTFSFFE